MKLQTKWQYIQIGLFIIFGALPCSLYLYNEFLTKTRIQWWTISLILIPPFLNYLLLIWEQNSDRVEKLKDYTFICVNEKDEHIYGFRSVIENGRWVLLKAFNEEGYLQWSNTVDLKLIPFAQQLIESQNNKTI